MITTAPVTADRDQPFLYELYASTRQEEMEPAGWDAAQVDAFLTMQFRLRSASYALEYPHAEHRIIYREGLAVGAWIVDYGNAEIHLVDIAFLPAYRSKGFGTYLLRSLQEEAFASQRPIRLQAERLGAALHLYERLGFMATGGDPVRVAMSWMPEASPMPPMRRIAAGAVP